jgi:hypothetical protein
MVRFKRIATWQHTLQLVRALDRLRHRRAGADTTRDPESAHNFLHRGAASSACNPAAGTAQVVQAFAKQ